MEKLLITILILCALTNNSTNATNSIGQDNSTYYCEKVDEQLMNSVPVSDQLLIEATEPDVVGIDYLYANPEKYIYRDDGGAFFVIVRGTVTGLRTYGNTEKFCIYYANIDNNENEISYRSDEKLYVGDKCYFFVTVNQDEKKSGGYRFFAYKVYKY